MTKENLRMSFNLERVPATLHSYEGHGKRAKRTDAGSESKAPTREKKIAMTLDVTDPKFRRILDECWAGSELLVKAMSGNDSPAQDIVSHRKLPELRVRVVEVDGKTEVFAIQTARAQGKPTLRVMAAGAKVLLSMRFIGPVSREKLATLDDHCECDVYVDVGAVQTTIDDAISDATNEDGEGEKKNGKPAIVRRTKGKGKRNESVNVGEHAGDLALVASPDSNGEGVDNGGDPMSDPFGDN